MCFFSIFLFLWFLSSMFYSFQCTNFSSPWLNLFLSILFSCYCKWDCFLNVFFDSLLLVYRNTIDFWISNFVSWTLLNLNSLIGFSVCFGGFFLATLTACRSAWAKGSNTYHSSDPSHSSDNTGSLTTRPQRNSSLIVFFLGSLGLTI